MLNDVLHISSQDVEFGLPCDRSYQKMPRQKEKPGELYERRSVWALQV